MQDHCRELAFAPFPARRCIYAMIWEIAMGATQVQENRSDAAAMSMRLPPMEAGWQRQGKLWSNLKELCALLRIPATSTMNDDDLLFQHVQFKTGQRIHTIGQPFDTLFIPAF
jgi:CRP/FNR family transcriptional regulator